MKRQRVSEGDPRILQDDVVAPKEDFISTTGFGQSQQVTSAEDETVGKTFNTLAPAECKEKANNWIPIFNMFCYTSSI